LQPRSIETAAPHESKLQLSCQRRHSRFTSL